MGEWAEESRDGIPLTEGGVVLFGRACEGSLSRSWMAVTSWMAASSWAEVERDGTASMSGVRLLPSHPGSVLVVVGDLRGIAEGRF